MLQTTQFNKHPTLITEREREENIYKLKTGKKQTFRQGWDRGQTETKSETERTELQAEKRTVKVTPTERIFQKIK